MNEEEKKKLLEEFKNAEGGRRLDMWDFALNQKVLWEKIIAELQNIANEQGVDKKLEEMMEKDLDKTE